MDIYVNVIDNDGMCEWYNHDDRTGETFLHPATKLIDWDTDEFAGTTLKTVAAAKAAGQAARSLAAQSGAYRPKVRYFMYDAGTQIEVKFTRDNQIKIKK